MIVKNPWVNDSENPQYIKEVMLMENKEMKAALEASE